MNKYYLYGAGIIIVLAGVFALSQLGLFSTTAPITAINNQNSSSAATTSPTSAITTTPATMTPQDVVPGLYPNPIKNTATTPGIKIASIIVENNTDVTGNATSDHLQLTLQNLTGKTLSNLEAYYTILDTANGKKEGYYKQLTGLTLQPYSTVTVHFDGKSGYGHYVTNIHGIYGTTTDQLKFLIEVSELGYAPVSAQATKAPGGAEVVGQ